MTDHIRDRVAEAICDAAPDCDFEWLGPRWKGRYRKMADAAIAAIHPTITTTAELDALPVGSVIRCGYGAVWGLRTVAGRRVWDSFSTTANDMGLPAIVLWTPEADH